MGWTSIPSASSSKAGRRKIFIGDQGSPQMLEQIIAETGGLDIVVDDGSHLPEHQLTSFTSCSRRCRRTAST